MNRTSKLRTTVSLAMAGLVLVGCNTRYNAASPGTAMPESLRTEQLTRAQYEVMGRVEGEGCAEFYALWPVPIFWIRSYGTTGRAKRVTGFGWGVTHAAKSAAMHEALVANQDADSLLEPRTYETKNKKLVWYRKSCVRTEAKAIRVKEDHELSADERMSRPRTSL